MKKGKIVTGLVVALAGSALGQVGGLKGEVGNLKGPTEKAPKVAAKTAYRHRVLQVLPEGLLMTGGKSPYLLKAYPEAATITDGEFLKFYGEDTGKTFQYTDVAGAVRTVKVIRCTGKLIGK